MQPINIYNSQDVNVTIDDNGTPVDVYVSGGFATALEFYPTYGDFPAQGQGGILYIAEDTNYIYRWDGAYFQVGGGSLVWGQITGTLSNQTDLQTALDDKVPYTGATQNINIGNNQLIADDGTNDSAFAPSFVGVENASGYSVIEPTGLYVGDFSGQMEVNALGLVFPDDSIQTTAGISGVDWGDIQGTLSNQTDLQTALDGKVDENTAITADTKTKITYDSKGLVTSGADAEISDITGLQTALDDAANKSLQDVTDIGNTTTNDIQLINDADVILGAGGKIIMDNGAKLQEGTTDAGNGGSKGIALKCSADYELKWEAGRLYTMEQNGFTIREVSHNFTFPPTVNDDDAKGFVIDSRWILDNGDVYICSDATTGSAVWSLQASPSGTVTSVDTEGLISGGPITTSGTITTSMATDKLVGRYSSGTGIMEEVTIGDGLTLTGAGLLNNTATPTPLGYYGAWQDNVTQTAAVSNIGYPMIFRTVDLENQVRVVTNGTNLTRITFDNTGIYNLQFSSQFQNTSNQLADATIWLRLNGTDVAGSSGFISIPNSHGGTPGHSIASWNYLLSVIAGQYYELVWSTSNHTNVTMEFYSAGSPPPSTASVILTVTQQSGIMAGTGITALNSLTGSVQTLVSGTSGSDFGISSSGTIHTFNLPTASATNRGALSSTDWSTFNSKESALTFSSPLSRSVNTISIPVASSSANGYLSSTDWTTFNNKQNALTNPVTGTGTSGQIAYWNGTTTQTGSATLTYTPTTSLLVNNSVTASGAIARGTNLTPTLTAAANSDVLVGLDINPTFTNGAFTGVTNYALRVRQNNNLLTQTTFSGSEWYLYNSSFSGIGKVAYTTPSNSPGIVIWTGSTFDQNRFNIINYGTYFTLKYNADASEVLNIISGGYVGIGTTSTTYKLDVNGTSRFQENLLVSKNTTSGVTIEISNTTAAAGSSANYKLTSDSSSGSSNFGKYSSSTTAYKIVSSSDSYIYNNTTAGDIAILNDFATGKIKLAAGGSSTAQATLFSTGNFAIGTTTDSLAKLTVSGSITASSAIARGVYFNNTLVAAANNDVLVGLDINPTFTLGAFTGTSSIALRTQTGNIHLASTSGNVGIGTAPTSTYKLDVNGTARVQDNLTLSGTNGVLIATNTAGLKANSNSIGINSYGANAVTHSFLWGLINSFNQPASTNNLSTLYATIAYNSGTSSATMINIIPDINTTAGTNTVRGIYYNPTLTSLTGTTHRAIETVTGDVLLSTTSGNVAIGTSTLAGYKLDVNGTARVQDNLLVSKNQNAATSAEVSNTTSGTASYSFLRLTSNPSAGAFDIGKYSSTKTSYKIVSSGDAFIYNAAAGDIAILNDFATGKIKFTTNASSTAQATLFSTGNLAIGTTTDTASAILTLSSTTKGFLPPVMTGAQGEAISSPATGLMIYTTSAGSGAITSSGWWGYNGTTWVKLN